MNLTDLSAELESRAEDLHPGAAMARLAAVRTRVRARRRQQAAAAALIAAGCAAAVLLGPSLKAIWASTAPAGRHQVKADSFDDKLAGDPLSASAVGVAGQREVVLRFTPADTNLTLASFCHAPTDTSGLSAAVTINGHAFTEGECERSTGVSNSGTPGGGTAEQIRAGWAALGVLPARESVIRIQLQTESGAPRADPSARLGVGLYALTGARIVSDGLVIKLDAESDGHDYRLAKYVTAPVGNDVRQVSLALPAGRWPVYLAGGTAGDVKAKDSRTTTQVTVDGQVHSTSTSGGTSAGILDDAGAHTLRVQTDSSSGVLLLAYYVRVD